MSEPTKTQFLDKLASIERHISTAEESPGKDRLVQLRDDMRTEAVRRGIIPADSKA